MDELTLTLARRIRDEARAAVQAAGEPTTAPRGGRARTGSWRVRPERPQHRRRVLRVRRRAAHRAVAGLRTALGATNRHVDLHELAERMLVIEAVETQRCLDEGVLTSVAEANVGSILGIGYPPWTGGVVQYVEGFPGGVASFVARADALAERHGERFRVRGPAPRAGLIRAPRDVRSIMDDSGTLRTWRTGCSRSSTRSARPVSAC